MSAAESARPSALDVSTPSPLRVWGFLCTALGAAMLGVGALLSWADVSIGIKGTTRTAATTAPGTDLWEGKVALAAAVVALIAVLAMRLVLSSTVRRTWGAVIVVAGGIAAAAILEALMRSQERIGGLIVGQKLAQLTAGLPASVQQRITDAATAATHVDLQPAIYVALFGAILVLIGGILGLLWTPKGSAGLDGDTAEANLPAAPDGSAPSGS